MYLAKNSVIGFIFAMAASAIALFEHMDTIAGAISAVLAMAIAALTLWGQIEKRIDKIKDKRRKKRK